MAVRLVAGQGTAVRPSARIHSTEITTVKTIGVVWSPERLAERDDREDRSGQCDEGQHDHQWPGHLIQPPGKSRLGRGHVNSCSSESVLVPARCRRRA